MSNKKQQYVQINLLTGKNYIGSVSDDFSPNFNEDMSFILYNTHCLYNKNNKNGETIIELISIEDSAEGFAPDMEIMWQSVATVQYLKENSFFVKSIENKNQKSEETKNVTNNIIVLNNNSN